MRGDRSQLPAKEAWSLEALLREYPWDEDVLGGAAPLEFFWKIELERSSDALWEQLVDTSRLNRVLGISKMAFEERNGELYGSSAPGGVQHHWKEEPWNWVSGRCMYAERAYTAGFSKHVRIRYDVAPRGEGAVLYVYFGFVPRNWLYRWLIGFGVRPLEHKLAATLRSSSIDGPISNALAVETLSSVHPSILARLDALAKALVTREVSPEALERLLQLVRSGDDMDVYRLQVRKLARDWKIPERKVLHLCLHATRLGMLELSWDVICPHCRGARLELGTLAAVPDKASCEPCALEFGTDGPSAIEITFRIHPSIRDVPKVMFCSAQTAERRHVKIQQVLQPGDKREVETLLEVGRYRLRVLSYSAASDVANFAYLDVGTQADDSLDEMAFAEQGPVVWDASQIPEHCRRESSPELHLHNDTDVAASFIVEDVNWADEALRPGHLFCYQGFRDLFSEEYIGADVHLAIGEQVILFTDIVGSTKLYLDRGDPQAFAAVRRHFTEVFAVVDEHEGAVVKTIGDATMAAFSDTVQALSAARAIHERFPDEQDADITLRISINTGVCIAVNLNSNVDYFGNAVNLAAKLQLAAGAGDIVLSEDAWAAPGVRDYVKRENVVFEPVAFEFDALGKTITAHRCASSKDAKGRRKGG